MIESIKTWWEKPAQWFQFWQPQSGPAFYFAGGVVVATVIALIL
jgi:hypothetical protein